VGIHFGSFNLTTSDDADGTGYVTMEVGEFNTFGRNGASVPQLIIYPEEREIYAIIINAILKVCESHGSRPVAIRPSQRPSDHSFEGGLPGVPPPLGYERGFHVLSLDSDGPDTYGMDGAHDTYPTFLISIGVDTLKRPDLFGLSQSLIVSHWQFSLALS
jgi:hypothetical protein